MFLNFLQYFSNFFAGLGSTYLFGTITVFEFIFYLFLVPLVFNAFARR